MLIDDIKMCYAGRSSLLIHYLLSRDPFILHETSIRTFTFKILGS